MNSSGRNYIFNFRTIHIGNNNIVLRRIVVNLNLVESYANLELKDNYLLPKNGVYKTLVYVRGIPHYAITNVGKNPTVGLLKHQIVESYIKDINEDLYGESIYVSFIEYLRDEKKFDSLDDLKAQLEQDKKTI